MKQFIIIFFAACFLCSCDQRSANNVSAIGSVDSTDTRTAFNHDNGSAKNQAGNTTYRKYHQKKYE